MFLGKRIKELREEKGLLQRQLAAELEIDSPMYSKIERGERRAKREQVIKLAKLFQVDENELLTLWLAGQVYEIVKDEKVAKAAMSIVETQIR
ncbi:MAG: helix-turn-helix transcriptional regulator [Petrimonas sp.]|jgi:transcriptional regulator with XRE-family HTH domain|nr:helix-turn-helix transcriptional regulator [Petrimonas sp.]MDD3542361.1 helix-turn-helix transcriptional regulator [Petrimonas sp.]MDD4535776.1 helix-turn-helix transcriptional regulator [Petrimonas sp.]